MRRGESLPTPPPPHTHTHTHTPPHYLVSSPQTPIACEQAFHLRDSEKSRHASGKRVETRQRRAGERKPLAASSLARIALALLAQMESLLANYNPYGSPDIQAKKQIDMFPYVTSLPALPARLWHLYRAVQLALIYLRFPISIGADHDINQHWLLEFLCLLKGKC